MSELFGRKEDKKEVLKGLIKRLPKGANCSSSVKSNASKTILSSFPSVRKYFIQ